ncbi:MAG: hypothetical protein GQF41_2975 [Candidatus Rifleibacterium amylolyticum]|nr:MAG: hypothetical protein GQF41_2975 [Candidatus Rifleibacterium amylolyticum]
MLSSSLIEKIASCASAADTTGAGLVKSSVYYTFAHDLIQ